MGKLRKLQGPLQTTYHIYTMKYSGSTIPIKHTTILEVECNQTERNMWTYGCWQTQPHWDGSLEKMELKSVSAEALRMKMKGVRWDIKGEHIQ